jgi:tetratricopeptide (TPR) repeat protein
LATPRVLAAPTTPLTDQQRADLRARYQQGVDAYNGGDWTGAINNFKYCYEESNDPSLLFNIAQAYRQLGQGAIALAYYQQFVKLAPDNVNVPQANAFIDQLSGQGGTSTGSPTSHPTRPNNKHTPSGSPSVKVPTPAQVAAGASSSAPASVPVVTNARPSEDHSVFATWWFWTATSAIVVTAVLLATLAHPGTREVEPQVNCTLQPNQCLGDQSITFGP